MSDAIFFSVLPSHDIKMQIVQKINACEAKRPSVIKIAWAALPDLHVTIAYIRNVEQKDKRIIGAYFNDLSKCQSFMARAVCVKIYGNAVVLCLAPHEKFFSMHNQVKQGLKKACEGKYHLDDKKGFEPHITLGRLNNVAGIRPLQKHQFTQLVQDQFSQFSFMIQQAALMQRDPHAKTTHYQVLHPYNLSR